MNKLISCNIVNGDRVVTGGRVGAGLENMSGLTDDQVGVVEMGGEVFLKSKTPPSIELEVSDDRGVRRLFTGAPMEMLAKLEELGVSDAEIDQVRRWVASE